MSIELKLPELGENIESGDVVSVLVREGVAYCAAGRSSYLDGAIRLCRLDAETGRLLSQTTVDHRDPTSRFRLAPMSDC